MMTTRVTTGDNMLCILSPRKVPPDKGGDEGDEGDDFFLPSSRKKEVKRIRVFIDPEGLFFVVTLVTKSVSHCWARLLAVTR